MLRECIECRDAGGVARFGVRMDLPYVRMHVVTAGVAESPSVEAERMG